MTAPQRIQRKRTKGWRMPEDAVYVGRPSKWGNPFTIASGLEIGYLRPEDSDERHRGFVTECFRQWLAYGEQGGWWFEDGRVQNAWVLDHLFDLHGRDLACWCPLDQPCHADVLLRLANGADS